MICTKSSRAIAGIYAIRHVAHGKIYIGSSTDIFERWRQHRRCLARDSHHSRHLQRAWNKYGPDAFVFEVLRIIDEGPGLPAAEQEALDHFQSFRRAFGYNIARDAAASARGMRRVHSTEHRARLSMALKGRMVSAETRAKISAANKSPSAETRAKISAANKRRVTSAKTRAKMSAARKGHAVSAGARAKISAANKNPSAEARAKMSAIAKERSYSAETRAKMAAANRRRIVSAETRAKMSAAQKGHAVSAETRAKLSAARRTRPRHPGRNDAAQGTFGFLGKAS